MDREDAGYEILGLKPLPGFPGDWERGGPRALELAKENWGIHTVLGYPVFVYGNCLS